MRLVACLVGFALVSAAQDATFFSEELYPKLIDAQCNLCHNDNGVASGMRFEVPTTDASIEQIEDFGLSLARVVNRAEPKASLLYLKPTNRAKHPGGERIKQGSADEALLLRWVERLARLSDSELVARSTSSAMSRKTLIRRLTHSQYNNIVRDLFGELSQPADQFPPEDFVHGFKNQAEGQGLSPLLMEAYGVAAEKVAVNAFRSGALPDCSANEPNCYGELVREFGRKIFRRPLHQVELDRYGAISREMGLQAVVEALLQSPHFLMRPETGGDLAAYDTASRLALFLWNTTPDDWLLNLAESGHLDLAEQIDSVAREMLERPKAEASFDEFLAQWMRFDRALDSIRARKFDPDFNTTLAAAMTEETRRLFNHLVWQDRDFRGFYNADYTFVNGELAELYGLPQPAEDYQRVDYPDDTHRAGVLGQGAFLTLTSKPSDTSPTDRGLFVRAHFLCQMVPPPPPGVNASRPPLTDAKPMTNRERLQVHLTSEGCVSCHKLIDPIGLGLEKFDAIGRFRPTQQVKIPPTRDEAKRKTKTKTTEHDLEIDTSGEVAGIAGSSFTTPRELGEILAENAECQRCIVKQLFRFATGRAETIADRDTIDRAYQRFRDSGFRFKELIISIATSEPFLSRSG